LALTRADRTFAAAAIAWWPRDDLPRIVDAHRCMEDYTSSGGDNQELMKKAALDGRPF
jgi:hypothetical protein